MTDKERFSRQARFAGLGEEGQRKLGEKHVLLVGVGALGSHLAVTLVRAGIGRLTLVDRDIVEVHNLPRQVLFGEQDAEQGRPKATAASKHLATIGGCTEIVPVTEDFRGDTYEGLPQPDLILDGTDNFATRYLINDLAVRDGVPWIYAGVVGARGTSMVILPGTTPCLRCVMPETGIADAEAETCETAGVLQPAVAMVAAFQGAQALKILSGQHAAAARGIFMIDVWQDDYELRMAAAGPRPDCAACGTQSFPALVASAQSEVQLCGRDAVQVRPRQGANVDLERLARNLSGAVHEIQLTPHLLRFTAEGYRFSVFPGGRAILFGLPEPQRARILYDRYVGA